MQVEIPNVLQIWLETVKSTNQNDAIILLAILGLKYYTLLYPQQNLEERRLRKIAVRDMEELLSSSDALWFHSRRKNVQHNVSNHLRRSRVDSMSHYPFADDDGNVKMVFMNEERKTLPIVRLVEMGKPCRKRLIQKVYNEMKYDKKGIKINDLPEALQRLGIRISSKLRSNLLNGVPLNNSTPYDEEHKSYLPEVFIQEMQWKEIVNTFYRLIKQGYDPASLNSLDIDTIRGLNSVNKSDNANLYGNSNREEDAIEGERLPTRAMKDPKKSNINSHKNPVNNISEQSSSYFSRLKKVPSRIGADIRRDRAEYLRSNQKTERIAASTLARRRLHMLTNTARGSSSSSAHQVSSSNSKPIASGIKTYQTMSDLNSGAAALGIADTFLNCSVGKELLNNGDRRTQLAPRDDIDEIFGDVAGETSSSSSEDLETLPLLERQRLATKSLGLLGVNTHTTWDTTRIARDRRDIHSTELHSDQEQESSLPVRVPPQAASAATTSGTWRSSKGGWVADFGAPHTHSLYTGPMYGAGKDALDGVSIAGDRVQWQKNRRQQQVPRQPNDWTATDIISKLADDLSVLEEVGRESIHRSTSTEQKFKYSRSRGMDLADEDSIDTATAGAGEGQQGINLPASFYDSISLKAALENVH